jgi:hypothetical protein
MYEDRPAIPINPGGVVDPRNVVGRDDDLARVVRSLERGGGVVQPGERRHGKTSFSRLVEATARERGWTVVSRSVEGKKSVDSVTEALAVDLVAVLPRMERIGTWLRSRARVEVAGVSVDRAPLALEDVLGDACQHAERLLLILDELPICARALEQAEPGAGLAFLHTLRRLRQEHPTLTMLCLGSIGFHHVVPSLGGALNDLDKQPLEPLAPDHAHELAARLLSSTEIPRSLRAELAPRMALASEGVPYYLHHLADDCQRRSARGEQLDGDAIDALVTAAIESPDDPWDLKHYVSRLPDYYGDDAPAAGAILDLVALRSSSLAAIGTGLGAAADAVASADLTGIAGRLEQDHYLVRDGGALRFRSELVRRAWLRWRT